MIRFGLVITPWRQAVGLGAQILGWPWEIKHPERHLRLGRVMKALAELIKTPAGMGFG